MGELYPSSYRQDSRHLCASVSSSIGCVHISPVLSLPTQNTIEHFLQYCTVALVLYLMCIPMYIHRIVHSLFITVVLTLSVFAYKLVVIYPSTSYPVSPGTTPLLQFNIVKETTASPPPSSLSPQVRHIGFCCCPALCAIPSEIEILP